MIQLGTDRVGIPEATALVVYCDPDGLNLLRTVAEHHNAGDAVIFLNQEDARDLVALQTTRGIRRPAVDR